MSGFGKPFRIALGLVVIAGDVAYTWDQFDTPENAAAALLTSLAPRRIVLAHETEPRDTP